MKFNLFLIGLLYLLQVKAQQPNVLFILSDDHSKKTIGAYADHLKGYCHTPTLDKLAKEGTRMNKMMATNALCAPSRASIITSMYSHETGVYTLRESLNTEKTQTLPKVFHENGYQTAVFGKWHIHGDNLHGFDNYAITQAQGKYFNPVFKTPMGKVKTNGYSTDVISDMGVKWLKNRNKDKPFMLFVHYKAAHGPWQYPKRLANLYKDINIPEPKNINDNHTNRMGTKTMQFRLENNGKKSLIKKLETTYPEQNIKQSNVYQKYIKAYLRCVKGIDEGVYKLMQTLEEEKLLDNTVVVYTSDQGMFLGEHGFYDKRLGLNEATAMPFIIRYPKKIKANHKNNSLVNNIDIAPTLLELCELSIPKKFQGLSFAKVLTGEMKEGKRKQSFYGFYSNGVWKHYGIVTKDFKLLHFIDKKGNMASSELYNLKEDPFEMFNIYGEKEAEIKQIELEKGLIKEMKAINLDKTQLPGKK